MNRQVLVSWVVLSSFLILSGLLGAVIGGQGYLYSQGKTKIKGQQFNIDIYGNIFVLDTDRNILRLFSKEQKLLREIGGSGWENDQFDRPVGLWARNGIDVFVADYGNHRIQRFDRSLNFVSSLFTRDSSNPEERFGYPTDVALSRLGDLYICDSENSRVLKVDRFNKVERTFGGFDAGEGRLYAPERLEIGPKDNVYVLDGSRVIVFDSFGNFLHELARGVFKEPVSLFADNDGVVVLDDDILYCFDEEERARRTIPIDSIAGAPAHINSIAFSGTFMYILAADGLITVHDPRPSEQRLNLDRRQKFH